MQIEFNKPTKSFQVCECEIPDMTALLEAINESEPFSIEPQIPGFHDLDISDGVLHGFATSFKPYETDCIINGMATKQILTKLETTEFYATENLIFTTDKPGMVSYILSEISAATGSAASKIEFERLKHFQNCFKSIQKVSVLNAKGSELRNASMSGNNFEYHHYNVVYRGGHSVKSITGTYDSSFGQLKISVNKNGKITIKAKPGFIIDVNFLVEFVKKIESAG